ncbi:2-octaprenyl-3-methyl-6-methoxy-1,4-benzoquinol hydroxylase [Aliivibrio salmonicida]|uniref:2-octaprenyl-3-methyl-6-methoxy-1,4-benzoquinol hydroxylase n=2 Tax=Aliivibrio salmonicida TaxID=40269 RepID=B6EIN9_ALISL|nr:2-octaprenyl-3-methyl-6-methoxy-1,4-benzoquinol hydroxylase [Aliivibrio salmonicida]CAQ78682.1 2-octaprenyl-3-methyl-6-methoxy-1,4-benzoquinol hydroxylase [Aliivibrio salmonicida LFI1238]
MMKEYDFAIVGGGMVGAAAAIGLAKLGYLVAIIEHKEPSTYDNKQPMDIRVSAISQSSVDLLEKLGAWESIKEMRVCPYKRLETWEHPECRTRFHSDALNMDQLGFIVENRLIQLGLWQTFSCYDNLNVITPTKITDLEFFSDHNELTLENGDKIKAKWVLGADGANSYVRQKTNIGITAWDYRQHCMLINIETEQPQQDITWQWFTPSGPRSFLPLQGNKGSLVWYDSPKRIKQLCAMNSTQLESEIKAYFPKELGEFTVEQYGSFPLTRRHAQKYVDHHCVLLGDAAHTINPLAGQGVNLGFKDIKVLLEEVEKKGLNTDRAFKMYESRRKIDNLAMQSSMDLFYTLFSNSLPPVKLLRNIGLKLADSSGKLKTQALKYALGL